MFSDRLRGGMDMASASMKNMYTRASERLGMSNFTDDELTEEEIQRDIKNYRHTYVGGLYNEGNTCFINSVIQALASCNSIAQFAEKLGQNEDTFSYNLLQLFEVLNNINANQHTHSTNLLMERIGENRRWKRLDQEDAQEYFQQLLQTLEKDLKVFDDKSIKEGDTETDLEKDEAANAKVQSLPQPKILTPFDGISAIRVGCLKCKHTEGVRKGVVSSIDLSLDAKRGNVDLYDLLSDYCSMETISGVECYSCTLKAFREKLIKTLEVAENGIASGLQERIDDISAVLAEKVIKDEQYAALRPTAFRLNSDKTKQTLFASPLPKVLMIHINRSVFDMHTGYIRKIGTPVKFPIRLNLASYTTDPEDPENLDPEVSMRPSSIPPNEYELKATVIHYGSANFGHYVCYRKFRGLWWRISDEIVNLTTEAQVLNAQGVFMLFYEQVGLDVEDKGTRAVDNPRSHTPEPHSSGEDVDARISETLDAVELEPEYKI